MGKNIFAAALVFVLLGVMVYAAFFIAPVDAKQGLIYRILYLHVSSARTGLTAFLIGCIANLLYVWRRQPRWDWLGVSAVEVGLAYTSVVLVTGPVWAHPVWGIWWTWDARLTSTFVMWLLYVSYLLLRTLVEEPDRRALLSALYGIFALLDVPLVFGSIRWWRTQHPQPIVMGGPDSGMDPTMFKVLMFSWLTMLALMTLLLRQRYKLEAMRSDVEAMRHELEAA